MFRFPIAMAIGLTVVSTAAHADTIIIQGTPSFEPAIITHGPMPEMPGVDASILDAPAFHRLAEMCETMGLACGADHLTAEGGIDPAWTPGHREDAEKRLAQLLEEREAFAEAMEEHFETLPRPHALPHVPPMLFGWNTPRPAPHTLPRALPPQFDHLFQTLPRQTLPPAVRNYPVLPHVPNLQGFNHRLNTPGAVVPRSLFPRHGFPWHRF